MSPLCFKYQLFCYGRSRPKLKAHMKSAKHKKNVKENVGAIGVDQFYSSESISSAEPGPSTSACSTSSSKQAHIRLITVSPQNFYE